MLDLLHETGMLGSRPTNSPMEVNFRLKNGVGESIDREQYQRSVGKLIYLSRTRLDITYIVSVVS